MAWGLGFMVNNFTPFTTLAALITIFPRSVSNGDLAKLYSATKSDKQRPISNFTISLTLSNVSQFCA